MTLRTPRRRISPQTKRRYRAIKGFFRRALGSLSQPDLQITSSIAVNVTDVKQKISGLEQKLDQVSKHYQDVCLDGSPGTESQSLFPTELRDEPKQPAILSEKRLKGVETKILYKTSESNYKNSDENFNVPKLKNVSNEMNDFYDEQIIKTKKNMSKTVTSKREKYHDMDTDFRKYKAKSVYENLNSAYSTSSFHSINQFREINHNDPGCSGYGEENINRIKVRSDRHNEKTREYVKMPKLSSYDCHYIDKADKHMRVRKPRHASKELDQDFIADIITRQYKPVKMFGRKESDLSQFSAPVCRDGEYCFNVNKHQGNPQLFSAFCCDGRQHSKYAHHSDQSDMRSVCDARLYSVKRNPKPRKKQKDGYNNFDIYDLVPVKEKSSPKSRRKFFEESMASPVNYKEVPPSPRTQRPRLNLKAQYYLSDDDIDYKKRACRKPLPKRTIRHEEREEFADNYRQSGMPDTVKCKDLRSLAKDSQQADRQNERGTLSSARYPTKFGTENTPTIETPLSKTQETLSSVDKTDKALCEIKDILQSFLQEIKKDASSHSGNLEDSTKMTENGTSIQPNLNVNPNSGPNCNTLNTAQFSLPQTPYMPAFGNTCCYPIMPMCAVNCMQSGYTVPSASFVCTNCVSKQNEANHNGNISTNNVQNETYKNETDELIKQIYKFVTQSPTFSRKEDQFSRQQNRTATKPCNFVEPRLTTRSAGESKHVYRHDVKVGTPKMKYVSKSCEAIVSKMASETYSSDTNASYSDTILEKHSNEATATQPTSETENTTDHSADKIKRIKLAKVMKSLGLCNKHRKDVIEELSESEDTRDVKVKKKPPFRQEVTNYMMHGQEYYQPPPVPQHYQPEYMQEYGPPYSSRAPGYSIQSPNGVYPDPRMQPPIHGDGSHYPQYHSDQPSAPPLSNSFESYNPMHPQVPLCLKEIEVKSIGCQSERKLSFFRKMTKKIQPVDTARGSKIHKNCSTQTTQNKPTLFSWKNMQPKGMNHNDTFAYTYKTQKKLGEGDLKMRNTMLKKLFLKKNPFSPNNLIIKTILGRDKSSFGDPPTMYRPRMFI